MARWTLPWKRGPVDVEIPDENVQTAIEAPDLPTIAPPVDLVHEALDQPIGCPRIEEMVHPGDRVALLVTDMHDRVLGNDGVGDLILDRLNRCGVPDSNVTLVHAAGLHGHAGARSRLGDRILQRVAYVEHDPLNEADLVFRGATPYGTPVWVNRHVADADFVMGVGGCGPSLYGYQGGAGIILPGVSGADTIRRNHTMIMSSRTAAAWWPDNPQREDVLNVGDLVGLRLKIDFAGNRVFAGYPREEWPTAVRYVQSTVMVPTEPADITIFAPAGNGAELMSMYMQLELSEEATRLGGIVIACISASAHEPLTNRPLLETIDEFAYCTRVWARESGEDNPLHDYWRRRDMVCKEELLARSLSEISRVVVRQEGEPRSTTHVRSHRRCLDRKRTFLVTEGITPEEGERMGFALVTDSFETALARAFDELGRDARVNVNLPPRKGVPYVRDPQ